VTGRGAVSGSRPSASGPPHRDGGEGMAGDHGGRLDFFLQNFFYSVYWPIYGSRHEVGREGRAP
jgi:hypothetical protein